MGVKFLSLASPSGPSAYSEYAVSDGRNVYGLCALEITGLPILTSDRSQHLASALENQSFYLEWLSQVVYEAVFGPMVSANSMETMSQCENRPRLNSRQKNLNFLPRLDTRADLDLQSSRMNWVHASEEEIREQMTMCTICKLKQSM